MIDELYVFANQLVLRLKSALNLNEVAILEDEKSISFLKKQQLIELHEVARECEKQVYLHSGKGKSICRRS